MGYTFRNLTLILKMMVWTRWLFLRWRIIMISSGMVSWLGITAGKRTRPTRPLLSLLVEIGSLVQVKSWQQTLMFARLIGGGFFGCKEFDNLEIYIYMNHIIWYESDFEFFVNLGQIWSDGMLSAEIIVGWGHSFFQMIQWHSQWKSSNDISKLHGSSRGGHDPHPCQGCIFLVARRMISQ